MKISKDGENLHFEIQRNNQVYSFSCSNRSWLKQENHFHCFNTFLTYEAMENEQPEYVDNALFANYAWITNTTLKIEIREWDHSAVTTFLLEFDKYHIVMHYLVTGLYTNTTEAKCIFLK